MFKKIILSWLILGNLFFILGGCKKPADSENKNKIQVVATTTMLTDLSRIIGGERVKVHGLMGPGIDPHLYQASAGDVTLMQSADVIIYNGLHLEGKMGKVFENLSIKNKKVICVGESIDESKLLAWEKDNTIKDPHIWFDVNLWKEAAKILANGLSSLDLEGKNVYERNLEVYLKELDEANLYIENKINEISSSKRVLITAHDAFQYFGKAYGFEVYGLQGISTETEAGTADVNKLADKIVNRQIKAIFVESSIPPKTIEALQAAVKAKGFNVRIVGELYSDSLGDKESGADTYILMVKKNIDTIIEGLK